mmetsp:Transcript_28388/g.39227  ORF Transcript_28388/g.39227 Transcript_28388/m.39227 type:complete len:148 (-) Transcript_28388:112-555(-)|eukprot:CAMPEP_0196592960 /NCGR_PEP_ID=MMETSP1081-20130531/74290_1 /TAXON_ID=36882 /ORGANISM="Pyramimonas amylifera, Strain CCMP720" /LENGTH=147 /DNA_ID=CAMNT_0041916791 /DNA_START=63 /DNA_END=506 /DNA_ORIENTATION=+
MSDVVHIKRATCVLFGVGMFLAGFNKLSPLMHAGTHHELVDQIDIFATTVWQPIGINLTGTQLRTAIGYTEVVCGAISLVPAMRAFATLILEIVLIGAIYTHVEVDDKKFIPACALFILGIFNIWLSIGGDQLPNAARRKKSKAKRM